MPVGMNSDETCESPPGSAEHCSATTVQQQEVSNSATTTTETYPAVSSSGNSVQSEGTVCPDSETADDNNSLVLVRRGENYPLKPTVKDEEQLEVPYTALEGESVDYLGRTADGIIALSNYRLFIMPDGRESFINIPIGLIESVEYREIFHLTICCKDARTLKCTFHVNELCLEWYKRISSSIKAVKALSQTFAFAFYAWTWDSMSNDLAEGTPSPLENPYGREKCRMLFDREVQRLQFDLKGSWKITYVNEGFNLCSTYPEYHIIPANISDEQITKIAHFRSSRRFPSIVWRDMNSGAVLARSSQPEVGWFGSRSSEDENLPRAILAACTSNQGSVDQRRLQRDSPTSGAAGGEESSSTGPVGGGDTKSSANGQAATDVTNGSTISRNMLIIDARSYTAAIANRAKGGGMECPEYYPNCDVMFMNLANIHAIRRSFISLRQQCAVSAESAGWLANIENTRWLQNISALLCSAMVVVNAIDREHKPVLVHCSDGWDRTPQIISLSQLMLDPFYRTMQGFRVLIEREWLAFGHRFADRCNQGVSLDDTNERCPVFLQWLDCVHQLMKQFPLAFQFNETYLVKLAHHTYSCLFGDFLCNTAKQREEEKLSKHTLSVWSLLNTHSPKFTNQLYREGCNEQVLRPQCHMQNMEIWKAVYLTDHSVFGGINVTVMPPPCSSSSSSSEGCSPHEDSIPPVKTRSCDDLCKLMDSTTLPLDYRMTLHECSGSAAALTRRVSDPNIVGACCGSAAERNVVAFEPGTTSGERERIVKHCEMEDHCRSSRETLIAVSIEDGAAFSASGCEEEKDSVETENVGNVPRKESEKLNDSDETVTDGDVQNLSGGSDRLSGSPTASSCQDKQEVAAEGLKECENSQTGKSLNEASSAESDSDKTQSTGSCQKSSFGGASNCEHSSQESTSTAVQPVQTGLPSDQAGLHSSCFVCNSPITNITSTTLLQQQQLARSALAPAARSCAAGAMRQPRGQLSGCRATGLMVDTGTALTNQLAAAVPLASGSGGIETDRVIASHASSAASTCTSTPIEEAKTMSLYYGRNQSSSKLGHRLDWDGLTAYVDPVHQRIYHLQLENCQKVLDMKQQLWYMERQLEAAKIIISRYNAAAAAGCGQCCAMSGVCAGLGFMNVGDNYKDEAASTDSGSGGERGSSVGGASNYAGSDMSWEPVEDREAPLTLWTPDHAVTHCAGCEREFWIARRRHHCRNCGKVFCHDCSDFTMPVPQQQLIHPVRVCQKCFSEVEPGTVASSCTAGRGSETGQLTNEAARSGVSGANQDSAR